MKTLGALLWWAFAILVSIIVITSWSLGRQLDQDNQAAQAANKAVEMIADNANKLRLFAVSLHGKALEAALDGTDKKLLETGELAGRYFEMSAQLHTAISNAPNLPLRAEALMRLEQVDERFRVVVARTLSTLAESLEIGARVEIDSLADPSGSFEMELELFHNVIHSARQMVNVRSGNNLTRTVKKSRWILALTLLLITLIFWFIRRNIVLRTSALARFVTSSAQDPLRVTDRYAVSGNDELTRLAQSVNGLFDRLQQTAVSKNFFDQVVENVGNALFVTDMAGRIRLVNFAAVELLDIERPSLIGTPINELMPCTDVLGEQFTNGCECQLNGSINVPVACVRTEIADGFIFLAIDLRERNAAQAQLHLAATVFDNTAQGLIITDASDTIISVNPAFTQLTGYSHEEAVGNTPNILRSGRHDTAFFESIRKTAEIDGYWHGEIWNRRKSGEVFPVWLSLSAVVNPQGRTTHFVALFSDITEHKEQEQRIEYLAFHDPLTGLPNRSLLNERLEQAITRSQRQRDIFAVMFLDLDHFKTINDSLGHMTGDHLLKTVSERLGSCVRGTDTVCRQGGDEFIIILTDLDNMDDASRVGEKILTRLADPIMIDDHIINTSVSIGISLFPLDSTSPDRLLDNADVAMYHAKQSGRNILRFYDSEMNEQANERLTVENGLRRALANNEFQLYYQPQYDIATRQIIGAEALIRWNHPTRGVVPPGAFITVAEESGLITPIGEWVMHEAIRQVAAWRAEGLPTVPVAVNVSAIQLRRGHLDEMVPELLSRFDLAGDKIELEITESLLVEEDPKIHEVLGGLKKIGLTIAIDDFGTGYSSLAYLRRFSVDKLKIDRSFVSGLGTNPDCDAIVAAIVDMSRRLHLRQIAEGVETAEQLEALRLIGCDIAQGYFFARPMPASEFARLLTYQAN